MSLPKYDSRPIQEIKLPISKEKISIKPYKVVQEQNILESMLDENDKLNFLINIKNILKENITGEFDIDNMFVMDLIFLNMKLRSISKSEMFEFTMSCSNEECKKYKKSVEYVKPIEDILFIKNSNEVKKIVKVDDNLSIELIPAKLNYIDYLSNKTANNKKVDFSILEDEELEKRFTFETVELALTNIAFSISKVIFMEDEKPKVYDKFSIEELIENVLSNLTESQIKNIVKYKNEMATMYVKLVQKCKYCDEVHSKELTDFFQYLT